MLIETLEEHAFRGKLVQIFGAPLDNTCSLIIFLSSHIDSFLSPFLNVCVLSVSVICVSVRVSYSLNISVSTINIYYILFAFK